MGVRAVLQALEKERASFGVFSSKFEEACFHLAKSCERFHRMLKGEFYDIAFRRKLFTNMEEPQVDLDESQRNDNNHRTHRGKYCDGKTPMQLFRASLRIAKERYRFQPDLSDSTIAA
jgi:hypothetical protein